MAITGVTDYKNTYIGYTNSANSRKEVTEEASTAKETAETESATRRTAAEELSYLSSKYSNYSFVAGVYQKGTQFGSSNTTNVMIDPRFLTKMANDSDLEAEYEKQIAMLKDLDAQMKSYYAARGWRCECGTVIDKDGGMSGWAIVTKDPNAKSHLQTMSENAEKIHKQNEEKKKENADLEEKRQVSREEKAELREETEEIYKEYLGNKFQDVTVIDKDDENVAVSKEADEENEMVTGVNLDIKA